MKNNAFFTGFLSTVLLIGALNCNAEDWVKNNVDPLNQSVEANYYDADSVKANDKTLSWTEKFILTGFGAEYYSKHLSKYPACQQSISKKGNVAYHQLDFEIKEGNFRVVAKRNYNKDNELLCTDKDMGTELDKSWRFIVKGSPMYERYYILATKYKLGI